VVLSDVGGSTVVEAIIVCAVLVSTGSRCALFWHLAVITEHGPASSIVSVAFRQDRLTNSYLTCRIEHYHLTPRERRFRNFDKPHCDSNLRPQYKRLGCRLFCFPVSHMNLSSSQQDVRWEGRLGFETQVRRRPSSHFHWIHGKRDCRGSPCSVAPRGPNPANAAPAFRVYKLDKELTQRSKRNPVSDNPRDCDAANLGRNCQPNINRFAKRHGKLGIINGRVIDVPNSVLKQLSAHPSVFNIHYDRPMAEIQLPHVTHRWHARRYEMLGLTGAGVTVRSSIRASPRGTTT